MFSKVWSGEVDVHLPKMPTIRLFRKLPPTPILPDIIILQPTNPYLLKTDGGCFVKNDIKNKKINLWDLIDDSVNRRFNGNKINFKFLSLNAIKNKSMYSYIKKFKKCVDDK